MRGAEGLDAAGTVEAQAGSFPLEGGVAGGGAASVLGHPALGGLSAQPRQPPLPPREASKPGGQQQG